MSGRRFLTLCLTVDLVCAVFWLTVVTLAGPTPFRVAALGVTASAALFLAVRLRARSRS